MLTVRDLMAAHPLTVAPEDTLRSAADLLTSAGIGGAPVVSDGQLIGVITLTDILAFEADDPGVPTFRPATLDALAGDEDDLAQADGIADPTASWFVDMWEDAGADAVARLEHPETPEWDALDEHMVAEVMSRALVHVEPSTPIADAARTMEGAHVHRLVVLEAGSAVGILTSFDIVKALAAGKLVPSGSTPATVG